MHNLNCIKNDNSKALTVHKIVKYGHLHSLFHWAHNGNVIHMYSCHGLSWGRGLEIWWSYPLLYTDLSEDHVSSLSNITLKYFVISWFMFNCNRKFQLTPNSAGRSSTEKRFGKIQLPKGQTEKKLNLWSGKKNPLC